MTFSLKRHGMFLTGLTIVLIMSILALLAPWIAPYDPASLNLDQILMPPRPTIFSGPTNWDGTSFPDFFMVQGSRYG